MDFKYKVTVIVPIYNAGEYLRDCLDSLVAQTINHRQLEVLLINDGSTDNSLDICNEYAQNHFIFKVFSKENKGVSAARNFGIRNAAGRYIMYLDSDDSLSENTVKSISDFFDTVYDEVDLVTYPERIYKDDGTLKPPHFRYNYLKSSGIYDLTKKIYCCQVNMNIAVKNLLEDNVYFDEEIGYHEDQMYCTEILSEKLLLGFVAGCEYRYNKRSESITGTNTTSIFLFEKTTAYWENLFNQYETVPQYLQALFFHDIFWKFYQHTLWPYHYSEEELQNARNRITKLLDRVDNSVIMSYPSTDNYQKLYWLRLKSNDDTCPIITQDLMGFYSGGKKLYSRKDVEIILRRILVKGNTVKIVGFFKSAFFDYVDNVKLFVKKNGEISELEKIEASHGYHKAKEKTYTFYQLILETEIVEYTTLEFFVEIEGIVLPTVYFNTSLAAFHKGFTSKYAVGSVSIKQTENGFIFYPADQAEVNESIKNNSKKVTGDLKRLRSEYLKRPKKRVWLYYDCAGVEKDNGYYQFIHDFGKQDGIERYYISANEGNTNYSLFSDEQLPFIVNFGSDEHKLLYLAAEKVITAFIEERNFIPFTMEERPYFCDVATPEIIYLQHGILHAHLPWKYSPGRILADKVVASSYFELDNFANTYHFREKDLIPSGMPRFNHIDTSKKPVNRILFAPSWRNYLTKEDAVRGWIINDKKFMDSDYYKKFNSFLNDERLGRFLEEKDLYLDFKIHPIFVPYLHCFENKNPRVSFAGSSVNDSEYALFITDFSSFVFDFAYLKRPIMYFVPDMLQFKAGMNQYRELDLPFERAFGKLTTEPEAAVDEVIRIVENGFIPDKVFKDRMDSFFLPMDNCEEKLYQYLIEEN